MWLQARSEAVAVMGPGDQVIDAQAGEHTLKLSLETLRRGRSPRSLGFLDFDSAHSVSGGKTVDVRTTVGDRRVFTSLLTSRSAVGHEPLRARRVGNRAKPMRGRPRRRGVKGTVSSLTLQPAPSP